MSTNNKQIRIGTVLSYVQMMLGCLIEIIYTPLMIRQLGQNEYGLYNTVVSTISMLSILSLGFNAGYIRYFSEYKKDKDEEKIAKLNGLFLVVFSVIGVVAFGCGMYLTFHLEYVFSTGLSQAEYEVAKVLMAIQTVSLSVSFPMSVFQTIVISHERFVVAKSVGMLKTICSPLISIPVLLMGYGSVALVISTALITLLSDFIHVYYVKRVMKEKFIFYGFERGMLRELIVYIFFIAVNMLVDQINMNVDKVLLGRYKGTAVSAVYSVGFSIYQLYQKFSSSVSSVFTPRIHYIVNNTKEDLNKQKVQLTALFIKVGRIQFFVLGLLCTGIIFFGKTFIVRFWADKNYYDAYYVALLLVIPATIPLIQNLGIEIQRAQNLHKFRAQVYLIMALINLVLSWKLCQLYGAVGSAIGTTVSLVIANGIIMNIFYHKKCRIDIIKFWKNILQMCRGLVIPIVLGLVINKFVDIDKIFIFLAVIILYSCVYVISMWVFSMDKSEKEMLRQPMIKFLRRS